MRTRRLARSALEVAGLGALLRARDRSHARRELAQGEGVDRGALARAWLRGTGLEVGALHVPIPVPDGVRVRYVDRCSREENAKRFPDLSPEAIVETELQGDGFDLAAVPDASQDFVLASHVLEHSPNPIGVLLEWSRVTRRRGILYLIVPIAEASFDAGRSETTLEHWIGDQRAYEEGNTEALRERNRPHYREWVEIAEPRIFAEQGHHFDPPTRAAVEMRVDQLMAESAEIHFHTFSRESFRALLDHFCRELRRGSRIVELRSSEHEVAALLRLA